LCDSLAWEAHPCTGHLDATCDLRLVAPEGNRDHRDSMSAGRRGRRLDLRRAGVLDGVPRDPQRRVRAGLRLCGCRRRQRPAALIPRRGLPVGASVLGAPPARRSVVLPGQDEWRLRMAACMAGRSVRLMARPAAEEQVLEAIRWAASRLGTAPEKLRVTSYRSVRLQGRRQAMPPEGAIRAAFGSWARARERAGIPTKRES
jgi:hypothetical protein